MHTLAVSRFAIPGDRDFPLNGLYARPSSSNEEGTNASLCLCCKLRKHYFASCTAHRHDASVLHTAASRDGLAALWSSVRGWHRQTKQGTAVHHSVRSLTLLARVGIFYFILLQWWMCFVKRKFMDKSLSGPGQWIPPLDCTHHRIPICRKFDWTSYSLRM